MTNSNDVEEGAVAKQAPEKKSESVTNQILFYTMNILGFCPFVIFFVIRDVRIATTAATGEFALINVLSKAMRAYR